MSEKKKGNPKMMWIWVVALILWVLVLKIPNKDKQDKPVVKSDISEVEQDEDNSNTEETFDFKTECEENAKIHPATIGAVLVTKGKHDFTGMKYYFKGEVIGKDIIENNVGEPSVWLVKNEDGYVMPIQHEQFNAEIGDEVEVWGTLSGNGYSTPEGVDNVVGETGSIHAFMATVNGEEQY